LTPKPGGLIPPNFCTTPPSFNGKGGREGKGRDGERRERGEGEGRGKEKGRDPQGLVDTPHVPNPEKYPGNITLCARVMSHFSINTPVVPAPIENSPI